MKCLAEDCNKEFENKTGRRKFCSNACKMRYFRKHGKRGDLKLFQVQAMYNAMMEFLSHPKNGKVVENPNYTVWDSKSGLITTSNPQSATFTVNQKTFQQHLNEIADLQFEDEYRKKYAEIEASKLLSTKEKELLYTNMKKSNL